MSRYLPDPLRLHVAQRAGFKCEYCLLHESDSTFSHEVDHIISLKHGGATILENLAYSCVFCNRMKGSDIGSVLLPSRRFVRFFDPRIDVWKEHFSLDDGFIEPLTEVGEVTVKILEINHFERIIERRELMLDGRYPRL
jgi:hypothetical protein